MQRKYIYIIVTLLIVIFCTSKYYLVDLSSTPVIVENSSKHIDDIIDEPYYEAAIKSPLIIKNLQNDDNEITYRYSIQINNLSGTYKCKNGTQDSYIIFSANGTSEFTLKSNETLTIYDVPNELDYTIEQLTNVDESYTTKANDLETHIATGTIYLETNVTFENNTKLPQEDIEKPVPENKPIEDSKNPSDNDSTDNKPTEEITKPEENDENDNKDNPATSDKIPLIAILGIAIVLVLINVKNIKIKRFE